MSKNVKFLWTPEADEAFTKLKNCLSNPPVLVYPDFNVIFRITTDASDSAVGVILSQMRHTEEQVIAYGGRALNLQETKYNATEKELCAIIYAIKRFRTYIYGTKFEIYTDHQPLKYIKQMKNPHGRLCRWLMFLEQFDF